MNDNEDILFNKKEYKSQSFHGSEPKDTDFVTVAQLNQLRNEFYARSYHTRLPSKIPSIYDYIIYESGSNIVAKEGQNGNIYKQNSDFSTVLQYILTNCGDNNHIFIKPPRNSTVYSIESTIEIPNGTTGITIEGGGFNWYNNGVVLKATGLSSNDAIIDDANSSQAFNQFIHLSFDGDETGDMSNVVGLKAYGKDDKVLRCSFYDCGNYGLETKSNNWIEKCWFEKCSTGIYFRAGTVYIVNNLFWDNNDDIFSDQKWPEKIFIRGNRSDASDYFLRLDLDDTGESINYIVAIANILNNIQNDGFYFEKESFDGVMIAHNILEGNSTTGYLVERNTSDATVTNSILHGNIALNMGTGLINEGTGWTQSDNVTT